MTMQFATLRGTLQLLDMRSSQRTYEFNGLEPYPHTTKVTVLSRDNEDADEFIASTDAIEGSEVVILAAVTSAGDILTGVDFIRTGDATLPGLSNLSDLVREHRLG